MHFVIEVKDTGGQAVFNRMIQMGQDTGPILRVLGEHETARIKQRFQTMTAPDGTRWQANAQSTIERYIYGKGGFSKKTGKITSRGKATAMGKRPLQGESGDLARQIDYSVNGDSVTIGSNQIQAAMQNFGGAKAEFPNLWGDIPGRPFMPVMANGMLYADEERDIVEVINGELLKGLEG